MSATALKSYLNFKEIIPRQFITTTGPQKGKKVSDFREIVGRETLRFKAKHMITTGKSAFRDDRWRSWFADIGIDDDMTQGIVDTITDLIISGLKDKQYNINYYIALYYRFHAELNDLSFADNIDTLVFGSPLREQNRAIFSQNTKPTAPFIHPPYVEAAYVQQRLERDPADGIWLNPHNHHSIKFSGRQKEKAHLDAFMARSDTFLICPVIAPSGAGKTRLISEWMKQYVPSVSATEWDAGFVVSRDPKAWKRWAISRNTLIVIDYTFAYAEVVKQVAQCARADGSGKKIRLIVIDHVFPAELFNDTFWHSLYSSRSIEHGSDFVKERFDTLTIQPEDCQSELLQDIVAAVAQRAGKEFRRNHPRVRDAVHTLHSMGAPSNPNAVRHPLFAALVGHALGQDRDISSWNRRGLIEYYFSADLRLPWKIWTEENGRKQWGLAVGAIVSAATLRRGLPISALKRRLPGDPKTIFQYAERIISREANEKLNPFEPDLLGEAFVLKFLEEIENKEVDQEKYRAWGIFILSLQLVKDETEELQVAFSFQDSVSRLVRNLLNDDQQNLSIIEAWDVLDNFLMPEHFSDSNLLRQAISVVRAEAVGQCWRVGQEARAAQFAKSVKHEDLQEASAGPLWSILAPAYAKYFEWKIQHEAVANENFLLFDAICQRLLDNLGSRLPALIMAVDQGCQEVAKYILSVSFIDIDDSDSEGWTALKAAALSGNTRLVDWLIEHKANVNCSGKANSSTALMIACQNGHIETVALLLDRGAQVDRGTRDKGATALLAACQNGHTHIASLLLDRGALVDRGTTDIGKTALMTACLNGHAETAALLLNRGAEVDRGTIDDGKTALMGACLHGYTETAALLLDRGAEIDRRRIDNCWTALMAASENGHSFTAALLLDRGANPNLSTTDDGRTALMFACMGGHTETAALLLNRGVEVNQRTTDTGTTALMAASENGHKETAELLVNRGAEVGKRSENDGKTALILPCLRGYTETALFLLNRGAHVDYQTANSEWTALMAASQNGHIGTVRMLLDWGAQVDQASIDDGWTALITASQNNQTATAALLLERGAKIDQGTETNGMTALMMACQKNHTSTASLLLERGAAVNRGTIDNGTTALLAACANGHTQTAKLLLDWGAKADQATTDNGLTALMAACHRGHATIAALLLDRGAALNQITTHNCYTALDCALEEGHSELAEWLCGTGAKTGREIHGPPATI